ncbi:phage tail protein I [Enterobacter quasiroggenkampii]|uniref:phage tail protein I n=1 Tax=Enterobacter quasiroggenkampii TaxID=2497436 RepID=UPI001F40AEF0|nr:phage tail protein I [Enterobacter quasiroggenkampii]
MDKFRSLLPPSAIQQERALEQASSEQITALDTGMVRKVKDPDTCPAHLLPWLAWEFSVDSWEDAWTEAEKRQVIKDAAYVHQHRGTAGAVRRSLSAVSLPTTVVEWWEDLPRKAPYTFRIEVYSLQEVDDALYQRIRRQVDKAKNLRSLLTSIDVIADLGAMGTYYTGGAVTAWIDIDIEAGV